MTEPSGTSAHGRWRLAYTPGDWLALAGPNAVVVLQPASPQWSELINTIWEEVLAAVTIEDLLQRMATFRLEGMPNFAAFFWAPDGMRSLVRGGIQLFDDATGELLADGAGLQTWGERAFDGVQRVRAQMAPPDNQLTLELPLIVGAAAVSTLVVDLSADRQVEFASAAAEPDDDALPDEADEANEADGADGTGPTPVGTAVGTAVETPVKTTADHALGIAPDAAEPAVPTSHGTPAFVEAGVEEWADVPEWVPESSTEPEPGPDSRSDAVPATSRSRTVAGVLRPSSGGRVEVDRPILIGRSPSASRVSGDQLPRLMTVPSPSHDISRTHLQVAPGDGVVLVTDLRSTNGTILVEVSGRRVTLEPDSAVPVEFGTVIDLGDGVTITVEPPDLGAGVQEGSAAEAV